MRCTEGGAHAGECLVGTRVKNLQMARSAMLDKLLCCSERAMEMICQANVLASIHPPCDRRTKRLIFSLAIRLGKEDNFSFSSFK